jgi:hypothetical protein
MNQCSPPLAIKEMQIKATLRVHLTRVQNKRNPHTLLVGMLASTTTIEISMESPQKTENRPAL